MIHFDRLPPMLLILLSACGTGADSPDPAGGRTFDEAEVQGRARTNLDSPNPTAAQLARRTRSIAAVKNLGLPTLDHLPVVEDETQITPRTKEEVAQRCLAVVICAAKGETNDHKLAQDLVTRFSAAEYFSPEERAFIDNPQPKEQDRVNFAWRYECSHVLLWALGYVDQLQPAHEICDVAGEVGIIRDAGGEQFIAKANLRPLSEVLDMADLYYHLHWAAVELRINGKESPAANEEIIAERHRALNWLIRYMNQDWDDVTTDT